MASDGDGPADLRISVIISCYNAAATLGVQLDALARQESAEPFEVIVADNGSTDGSPGVAERYKERISRLRLVDASRRAGPAHARNVGADVATGEILAFCDADDEVAPGWLAALGKALERCDFVASRFDVEKLNAPWVVRSRSFGQRESLRRVTYAPYLPHAGGSGIAVKRWVHESVGGFDESLLRLSDTDYCFRIQLAGVKLHLVPDAVVHVRYRDTLGGMFNQARLWARYNVLLSKRYRPPGMPWDTSRAWYKYLLGWTDLVLRAPRIRSRGDLARWARAIGHQVGLLQGSIRYGVPPW